MTLFGMPVIFVEPEESEAVPGPIVLADWGSFMDALDETDTISEYEI